MATITPLEDIIDKGVVDNAMYGASLPNYYYSNVPEVHQMKDPESDDNTPMKRNVCYAATLVGDGRYGYISWSNLGKNTEYNTTSLSMIMNLRTMMSELNSDPTLWFPHFCQTKS